MPIPSSDKTVGASGHAADHNSITSELSTLKGRYDTHEVAADPHTMYQKESEKGQPSGYAGLDATSKIASAALPANVETTTGSQDKATAAENNAKAHAIQRANHTGTQPSSTISDFNAAVDARVTAANEEFIRDTMGTALVAGANITITPNDAADTITISTTGGGEWTTYTPVLTASTTDPTIGTGGSAEAAGRYEQIGKTVNFQILIRFGTASVGTGSGTYRVSLPVAARSVAMGVGSAIVIDGQGYVQDDSEGSLFHVVAELFSTTTVILARDASGYVAHNAPFAFAANDSIRLAGTYEAA